MLTVVHSPDDARIWHRQIRSLLDAGWQVTYAAPWAGYDLEPPAGVPDLRCIDVVRATGRDRLRAQVSARGVLRREARWHDVVLLHDPELIPTTLGLALPPVVWDVHEDAAAALEVKTWLPQVLRRPVAGAVRQMERLSERRHALLLADHHYADRFRRTHPVVPNTTTVPRTAPPAAGAPGPDGTLRAIYLGSITLERGAAEMARIGQLLQRQRSSARPISLEIIGPAHGPARDILQRAHDAGDLSWSGPVPNDRALTRLDGALAGLSLLHDRPNFRLSLPTKVVEYFAHGVPVITTPLPLAVELVQRSSGGVVIPFGTVEEVSDAAVSTILSWADQPEVAADLGARAYTLARRDLDWRVHGPEFVAALDRLARQHGRSVPDPAQGQRPCDDRH